MRKHLWWHIKILTGVQSAIAELGIENIVVLQIRIYIW